MIDACPESAVLFFDVDGTLTSFDPDNMTDKDFSAVHPSQAVVEAFHRLRDAGHQAFICTGRPLWLIADSLRALDPAGIVRVQRRHPAPDVERGLVLLHLQHAMPEFVQRGNPVRSLLQQRVDIHYADQRIQNLLKQQKHVIRHIAYIKQSFCGQERYQWHPLEQLQIDSYLIK